MAKRLEQWAEQELLPMEVTRWNRRNPEAERAQCGLYRPDFAYEMDAEQRVLLVDYDEHAHQTYSLSCELKRQVQIALGFGGRPVTFIRYNPDTIRGVGNARKRRNDKEREQELLAHMQVALAPSDGTAFDHFLTVVYLFYYPILESEQDGNSQVIRFKTVSEYEEWAIRFDEANNARLRELANAAVGSSSKEDDNDA